MTALDGDRPAADELADDHDQDGWDRNIHGTFAEYATGDDVIVTVSGDDYWHSAETDG